MRTYELPIEAARLRLSGKNTGKYDESIYGSTNAWVREYGRRATALAIIAALKAQSSRPNRVVGPERLLRASHAVASGWVLCEHLTYLPGKKERQNSSWGLQGLLLGTNTIVYGYKGRVQDGHRVENQREVDAWGEPYGPRLKSDDESIPSPHITQCRQIEGIALGGITLGQSQYELDCKIGSYAGLLTLEDLYAGMIVAKNLEVPAIEVPTQG